LQFDLLNSFPRKKLEDRSETIAAAGLQNAALTQVVDTSCPQTSKILPVILNQRLPTPER